MFNEDGKIRTVSCKNCHHSFDKIKCQHGPAQIYWQDFTTKGIEEEKKKKKDKKEWKDFWDFVALVFLTILVVWLFLIALGGWLFALQPRIRI